MSDGIKKNAEQVVKGWKNLWSAWRARFARVRDNIEDKDWKDLLHNVFAGFLSDLVQEPYRTWLYLAILGACVYLGSLFLPYNWPLSWTGF